MKSFTFTTTLSYGDGLSVVTKVQTDISDLRPISEQASNSFALTTRIPNLTSVDVEGEPGIHYHWMNGEVVKTYDSDGVQLLKRLVFGKTQGTFGVRLIIVLGALLLMVATLYWWRRNRASA